MVEIAKKKERERRIELKRRLGKYKMTKTESRTYICFIDLRKAFDTVDRDLIIAEMIKKQLPMDTICLVAKIFRNASFDTSGGIRTFKGL